MNKIPIKKSQKSALFEKLIAGFCRNAHSQFSGDRSLTFSERDKQDAEVIRVFSELKK